MKLSAYVELYLKQDWSLLPVPDFKLVARSDEITSHLNFMVAAVLLTASHSGKNVEFERILELVIPSSLRKDIQTIEDAFSMALEPKSPKSSTNSPRRTSLTVNNNLGIVPKVLFPSNLSFQIEDDSFEIKVQEIQETEESEEVKITEIIDESLKISKTIEITQSTTIDNYVTASAIVNPTANTNSTAELINLQNEIKLLEIKLSETDKLVQQSKEVEESHSESLQNLSETRLKLYESYEEMRLLKERQEYEKIERNSLMAGFDHERQILEDQIEHLTRENNEIFIKITNLQDENKFLKEEIEQKRSKAEELEREQKCLYEQEIEKRHQFEQERLQKQKRLQEEEQLTLNLLNESKLDNSKLVKALNKARDHIINQDSLIKELREALQESEIRERDLKSSYEQERTKMNQVLTELGNSIQRKSL